MNQETKDTIVDHFEREVRRLVYGDASDRVWARASALGQILAGFAALEALELSQRAAQVIGPRPSCAGCGGTGQGSCGEPCRYCDGTGLVP